MAEQAEGRGSDLSLDKLAEAVSGLVARHNNEPLQAIQTLLRDNFKARERARELEAQLREAQGKLPGADALILTGEEAKAAAAFRALKLKPEEIQTALQEREQLKAQWEAVSREQDLRELAKVYNFEPAVFQQLAADLEIEIQSVEHNGQKITKAAVVTEGKSIPLEDYAKTAWKPFLPALQPAAGKTEEAGAAFLPQGPGAPPAGADPIAAFLTKRNEAGRARRNPLIAPSGNATTPAERSNT